MASQGFRGLFGLDLILDGERVYPIEVNPRFQNSTSLLTHLSLERADLPLTACHLAEFTKWAPRPLAKERAAQHERNFIPLEGAQMILHNRLDRHVRIRGSLRPGIYTLQADGLNYVRPGLTIEAVNSADECLIACGVPDANRPVAPKAPLLKIQTRTSVLTADRKRLSPWAKRLARSAYDHLKIVEEETALTHV